MTQPQMIQADHSATELDARLRQSASARVIALERARDASRQPAAAATPEQPKPKPKSAARKATPPKPARAQAPAPHAPQAPALPPGARIMTAEEMTAIDHLLQTHPETKHLFSRESY